MTNGHHNLSKNDNENDDGEDGDDESPIIIRRKPNAKKEHNSVTVAEKTQKDEEQHISRTGRLIKKPLTFEELMMERWVSFNSIDDVTF